jgi:hypothetical protein
VQGVVAGRGDLLKVALGPLDRDRLDVQSDGGQFLADLGVDLLGRRKIGPDDVERIVELQLLAFVAGFGEEAASRKGARASSCR